MRTKIIIQKEYWELLKNKENRKIIINRLFNSINNIKYVDR